MLNRPKLIAILRLVRYKFLVFREQRCSAVLGVSPMSDCIKTGAGSREQGAGSREQGRGKREKGRGKREK
ncbi:hypothetical protein BJP34_27775 [Moorena producens PAL-8-15-08-1]|uniref:Uncharacterized protein n=1 Tax=Moorena producens PAL-8-15-08-1 TaxID=1458985 RepID=A0A1D8TYW4_9CYAN|nr:hypothetical protein BJP34_27775 [Moorena producens PAL-8-15-08-1]